MSHAPSNLPNLLPAKPAASPQPVEKPAAEREGGKDENGFLRSDLRREIRDDKVECLGCSKGNKTIFYMGASWYWNRHVQRVHMQPQTGEADVSPDAQLDTKPDVQPSASPLAEQWVQRKTSSSKKGPESVLHSSQLCRRCSNLLRKMFPIFFGWLKPRNPRKHAVLDRNSRVLSVLEKNAPCRLQNPTLTSLRQGSDPISFRLFLTQRQSRRVQKIHPHFRRRMLLGISHIRTSSLD